MNKRRILAIIVILCLAVSLVAGCGDKGATNSGGPSSAPSAAPSSSAPSQAPSTAPSAVPMPSAVPAPENVEFAEHLVFVGTSAERIVSIDTTNPITSAIGSNLAMTMIYDKLVEIMPEGDLIPELAKSWDISDDYRVFTFHLRDDAYFHNGEKFTADDVAFTIERSQTAPGTQAFDRYGNIEKCDIINDYEIVITLKASDVDFIYNITWPACGIQNRKAITDDPVEGHYIGTGKYKVKELVSDDYLALERFEDYWKGPMPTKFVTFRAIAEDTARFIMLENGEANLLWSMTPIYVAEIEKNPDLDYLSFTLGNAMHIGFNMNHPILGDVNFRRAVAHAVNRQEMVAVAREGYATIPANPVTWGYLTEFRNEDVTFYEYDLDKARELLAMTAYKGEPIDIIASNPYSQGTMQVAVANLAEIGINLAARNTDTPGLNAGTEWGNQDFRMYVHAAEFQAWASSARVNYYPGVLGNRSQYNNPEVTALLDEAMGTFNDAAREAIYRRVQEIIADDCPYVTIYHHEMLCGTTAGLGGIIPSPSTPFTDFSEMYLPLN